MWNGFWTLIKSLPAILALLDKIQQAIAAGEHELQVSVQLKKIDNAIEVAKSQKDTSDLEHLFNGK